MLIFYEQTLMMSSSSSPCYERLVSDMRDQLLDAARDVLREKGIMGATTREIARAAKCADGTLYNHFRTREELFLALFERTLPMFRSPIRRCTPATAPSSARPGAAPIARTRGSRSTCRPSSG
jgi:AcrR family transcriptional regulator